MRNKLLLPGLLLIITFIAFAFVQKHNNSAVKGNNDSKEDQGILFIEGDWNKALVEAKKQNQLIFLDAYASWCGPCKLLKKKTFPDKAVGEFFNANYINVAMNMEKGDGPFLGEKYGVNSYPTLIITDADGNILTYTQGYMGPKQLIDFGKYGLSQKKK